jgi:LmbE family N-acetylglucosaminyl deacetylase
MPPLFSGPPPYRLDLLEWPRRLRVTVLAPHPDDFDEIGVTLRRLHANGHPIHLAVLSACSGVEDSFCSPPTPEVKTAIRQQEQRDSCRFFGLSASCLEFPNLALDAEGQPADCDANGRVFTQILNQSQADLVFLPHGNDTNAGHRQTWAMFRRTAQTLGRCVTAFYNRDPKTIAARADAVMPFDQPLADWKGELLRFHRSQHHRNLLRRGKGLDDRILEVNRRAAEQLGCPEPYAEVFEVEAFGGQ